ncbi:hypothetical protein EYF80_008511 [Liparis tanakae]|uniref:Uncharacterized protein n=1 Tax=Liparis tanakae TaxID=230148 RepID=A0A4Z2ITV6_9TELE|nr:hypothetical protein EYF80_008511 [Liparis tanakae]
MKLSLLMDLVHSSVLGGSRLGLRRSSPERVVLEMTVMGLCRESAWLFSVLGPLSRVLLVESVMLKGCPFAGLASCSFPSLVVVEILLESGPSLTCPSLLSSSLSSSLSQKSAKVHFRVVFHLFLRLQSLHRPEVGGRSLVPQRREVEPGLRGSHQLVHDRLSQGARQREGAAVRESQSREERRLVTQHCTHGKFRTPRSLRSMTTK